MSCNPVLNPLVLRPGTNRFRSSYSSPAGRPCQTGVLCSRQTVPSRGSKSYRIVSKALPLRPSTGRAFVTRRRVGDASRRSAPRVQALFGFDSDTVDSVGNLVLFSTIAGVLLGSYLPLLCSGRGLFDAPEGDPGDFDDDDIKWTVMGVISCIPLVNWTAWIFGALDDPARSTRYYAFAALYFLPYLKEGIRLDTVVLLAAAAGALHLQVERAAAQAPPPPPPPPSGRGGRAAVKGRSDGAQTLEAGRRTSAQPLPGQRDPRSRGEAELWGRKQLSDWDGRLSERKEGKQQRKQQR